MPSPAPIKTRMSEAQIHRSLATWQRRQHYRYERVRYWKRRGDKTACRKWERLAHEADGVVVRRRRQLAYVEGRKKARRGTTHPSASARQRTVQHAQAFAGKVSEQPAGSNRGGIITTWEERLAGGGTWLVGQPWCGTFAANMLLFGGVHGVTARLASVALIEDDARAGHGCFRGWTSDASKVLPGDLVVLFGRGVHVELVVRVDRARGLVFTVGGNTSSGTSGSQANGGGVYARARALSAVHGFALVDFPSH